MTSYAVCELERLEILFALFFFFSDLSGCPGCNNSHDHIKQIKKGNVSCEIEFEVPPVNPLQLMIYTTHRKKLTIDALRTLKFEY